MECSFVLPYKAWSGLYHRYARVTDYVAKLYNTTPSKLFSIVRRDRSRFERLKFIIKLVHVAALYDKQFISMFPETGKALVQLASSKWAAAEYFTCPDLARIYALYLTDVKYYLALPEKSDDKDKEILKKVLTHAES
jgi:hypothetical protein